MRKSLIVVASACLTALGLIATGGRTDAQIIDGLDLGAIRARAAADPETLAAFEAIVAKRGERFWHEAEETARQAHDNLVRAAALPNGTTATPASAQSRRTVRTSSWVRGATTASGAAWHSPARWASRSR